MVKPVVILRDSREQAGYSFDGPRYEGVTVEVGALATGDYAVKGLESLCAVERKSLPDLLMCLGHERPRFVRELERGRGLDAFAVIIEASMEDVSRHRYTSRMNPHAAMQSVLAFQTRYGVPFVWAGSRQGGEYVTHGILRQYVETARKRLEAIHRAVGAAA